MTSILIKVSVSVRLRLIILSSILIILVITKTSSNNCLSLQLICYSNHYLMLRASALNIPYIPPLTKRLLLHSNIDTLPWIPIMYN